MWLPMPLSREPRWILATRIPGARSLLAGHVALPAESDPRVRLLKGETSGQDVSGRVPVAVDDEAAGGARVRPLSERLGTRTQQFEQFCDVCLGSTFTSRPPDLSAL